MRKNLILNWKHHWVDDWSLYISLLQNNSFLLLAPPVPLLGIFAQYVPQQIISPHITPHLLGSITGACGPQYLKQMAIGTVLLGHSEQRQYISSQSLSAQIHSSLEEGIKIILCVGESNPLNYQKELFEQLQVFMRYPFSSLSIAYEPRWAIGTQQGSSMEHLDRVINFIREILPSYNPLKIYYGGGVDRKNIESFWKRKDLEGLILGSMSLNIAVIEEVMKTIRADIEV